MTRPHEALAVHPWAKEFLSFTEIFFSRAECIAGAEQRTKKRDWERNRKSIERVGYREKEKYIERAIYIYREREGNRKRERER